MPTKLTKTLLLFNYDWDCAGYERHRATHSFTHAGFDLFSFPSNANLVRFDMDRFVSKLAKQARAKNITAVSSQNEQFGSLAAALLAEKMGWAGTPPKAVVACQHKLYAREVLERVCPEANVAFARLPYTYGGTIDNSLPNGLRYPVFAKPIKAAFSVLARMVQNQVQLHDHTRFGIYERWVIERLVEPFDRIAQRLLPQVGSSHSLILEEPASTTEHPVPQYSLDGIAFDGEIKPIGVVDSIMYPGTQSFMRFDYPSQLAADAQVQALIVAKKFLNEVGFTHGIFNMEFFYDARSKKLTVIEFNPRMASQFADLYLRVDGRDLYAMALALAHGENPWNVPTQARTAGAAASFVYREFKENTQPVTPTANALAALKAQFPDHLLMHFPKAGHSLKRDFKWLGSYRYGILHLGGADAADLRLRCEAASALLQWPASYLEIANPAHLAVHATETTTLSPLSQTQRLST
jgi:hypothetical protein